MIGKFGKRISVGFSTDINTASKYYSEAKADYLVELANINKNKISEETYDIILNRAKLIRSLHEDCLGY